MDSKELIIGYLEYVPDKKCTIFGLALLFEFYGLKKDLTADLVYQMYLDNEVTIIDNDQPHLIEVRLIPKLKIVK